MFKRNKYKDYSLRVIQKFFLYFALFLSIGSLVYLAIKKKMILSNIWLDSDIGHLITYIGILATSAFSVLVYFVNSNTLKTNEQLFYIQKMRFRIDMLPIKQNQKEINLAISECNAIFQKISFPLNDYIINEANMENLIKTHEEWIEERDRRIMELDPAQQLVELVTNESPLHIENKRIKQQIIEDTKNIEADLNKCLELVNKIETLLTSEIQAILVIDIDIKGEIMQFYKRNRIGLWSLKSALDRLEMFKDIGIITDVPYFEIFSSSVSELNEFRESLDRVNKQVKETVDKLYS